LEAILYIILLKKKLIEESYVFTHQDILNIIDQIVYFSEDYEAEINNEIIYQVEISKQSIFKMTNKEIIKITETFFNPSINHIDGFSISTLLRKTVDSCSMYGKCLLRGIVLSGKLTQIKGFNSRFNKELQQIYHEDSKFCHTAKASQDRDILSWQGAKVLSNHNELVSSLISSSDFQKHGFSLLNV